MISPVSVVYSEIDRLIHSLSVATYHVFLYYRSCGMHWCFLGSSLSLELSLNTFREPTLTILSFILFLFLLLGLINQFKYNKTMSTIFYNSNNVISTSKDTHLPTYLGTHTPVDFRRAIEANRYTHSPLPPSGSQPECGTHPKKGRPPVLGGGYPL